jgi:hypothetical protein
MGSKRLSFSQIQQFLYLLYIAFTKDTYSIVKERFSFVKKLFTKQPRAKPSEQQTHGGPGKI